MSHFESVRGNTQNGKCMEQEYKKCQIYFDIKQVRKEYS